MHLEINKVTKKYGSFTALSVFSATLESGIYGLLGPNGAGKSTLANIVCDTLKPTSGDILYNGVSTKKMGKEYRNLLGFAPQVSSYYKDFSTRYFLEYMGMLKEIGSKADIKKRVDEVVDILNLTDVEKKKIGKLSGGMKQRVGIAQAILNDPKILILDEPTAGLDPKERIRLRNILSKMSFDRITLIATHIVSDIEYIAGKVMLLKKGNLIEFGTLDEILSSINDKVFKITVPKNEVDEYSIKYKVVNVIGDGNMAELRIVSDSAPNAEKMVSVKPCLEDAYLFYFDELNISNKVDLHD
ncbi:MAG: ATP-binding cassette domain-containing protein [Oscillospiraceae bacterium]|nr:ATP-binding cassette domain-containing protein [Oscillospiraceae bacterium]